jgi:hypothetical protein
MVKIQIVVFWVMTPHSLVDGCQHFGRTYCLHLRGWSLLSCWSGWLCRGREWGYVTAVRTWSLTFCYTCFELVSTSCVCETQVQLPLSMCEFEECSFILMPSINLYWFKLVAHALMQISCCQSREAGKRWRRNAGGEGKMCPSWLALWSFTLCKFCVSTALT